MEGAPKSPYQNHHQSIFEFKQTKILALNGDGKDFYLLDNNYVLLHLTRERRYGQRVLTVKDKYSLKEIQ